MNSWLLFYCQSLRFRGTINHAIIGGYSLSLKSVEIQLSHEKHLNSIPEISAKAFGDRIRAQRQKVPDVNGLEPLVAELVFLTRLSLQLQ